MKLLPRRFASLCLVVLALIPLARGQVIISEFVADNQVGTLTDSEGDHSDWLELWNSGATAVSLNGWYLTDDSGDLRQWQFPVTTPAVNLAPGGRIVVFASSKDRKLEVSSGTPLVWKLHTNFKLTKSAGGYLALVRPDGLTIEDAYTSYPQQVQDVPYGIVSNLQWQPLVPEGAVGKAKIPVSAADMPTTTPVAVGDWRHANFNDSTWQAGQSGFGYDSDPTDTAYGSVRALLGAGGDLQPAGFPPNPTTLIRIPFNVSSPSTVSALRLSMKYDDGFNCYLNGTLVQSSLSGGTAWNSASTTGINRNGGITANFQVFNPAGNPQNALVSGTNVLAIQLLNSATEDSDNQNVPNGWRSVARPLLEGNINLGTGAAGYLATPTPGATNSLGRTNIGPGIINTTDRPARPSGDATSEPIVVTTKVVQTLRPLGASNPVLLRYKIMQAAEVSLPMRDNGIAPDAIANDGIFTAQIPTINLGVGQMIRWRVTAADNTNVTSANPPYLDTLDNDQYFGTVTQDNITTSLVPILHWFVQDGAASRLLGGTRCSLFYLDRFYDNVFVNLHGQSSSGFAVDKKSHNFNFNEDNRFKWKEGEDRQRAINLLTTWADKSRIRDTMAWETWQLTDHIAGHWANIVRVHQNGAFWGIYDMVENGDEDFMSRAGLDPDGALYKMYNLLDSTAGAEKKTRDGDPSTADLQALINALATTNSLASRRSYSYDNVDIPSMVNFLATNVVIINNDFGHKNYYIYRDTNGTREWSLLPWDQDLSIGHTWTSSQNYFNDDLDSQRGLILGAAQDNRLMNLIMRNDTSTTAPEMVRMFMRRLRTIMDKLLVSPTATDGPLEQRMTQLLDSIDPPGAAYLTDADLDLRKWGFWTDGNGAATSPNNVFDAATHPHGARQHVLRILNSNPTPTYPASASNPEGLGDTRPAFMPGRRTRLFNGGLTLVGQPIPPSQPAMPTGLTIEHVDFNPGNQTQEFLIIRNDSAIYVDISGWKLTGAIDCTFLGGTVIPPFTSASAITATGDVHAGRLHVARDPFQFRQRTASPRGGQFRLVTGPYSGQLSARGETINLIIPGATPAEDVVVATTTYAGAPTSAQDFLRVTELSYFPVAPTASELAALPGVQASDFEFIELTNTGASPLNLGGCTFTKGISFVFPAGFTLGGGERCIVAALPAAFNLRHVGSGAIVAGQFSGNLDNSGETIQLLDSVGELVLEFRYEPLWFGAPNPASPSELKAVQGYSLVSVSSAPLWNGYETPTNWVLGGTQGGTPGASDLSFSNVFVGWRKAFFTAVEETDSNISSAAADPDNDGRSNYEEFVYGGNPRAFENKPQPAASLVEVEGANYLAITFDRRRKALDTTFTVEVSSSLPSWTPIDIPVGVPTDLGNGMERVTYRDSLPAGLGERFLRARATR